VVRRREQARLALRHSAEDLGRAPVRRLKGCAVSRDRAHLPRVIDEEDVAVLEDEVGGAAQGVISGQRPAGDAEELNREAERVVLEVRRVRRRVAGPAHPGFVGTAGP